MITVQTTVASPIEHVWKCWTMPHHITKWTFASEDWESPYAENDLRTNGKFKTRMQSKDGKHGFDFEGSYENIIEHESIKYSMADGRKVQITFKQTPGGTQITESFDPENENPHEMQQKGWQAILDNFKKYTESQS